MKNTKVIISSSSLKRLQVIDLVTNRGTFEKFAPITIPADDFLDTINEFDKTTYQKFPMIGFKFNTITANVSETLTDLGLCTTFNMALLNNLLFIDKVSRDFHFQLFNLFSQKENSSRIPRRIASTKEGVFLRTEVDMKTNEYVVNSEIKGFVMYIHDPYELPTSQSTRIALSSGYNYVIWLNPEYNSIDESLSSFNPIE